MTRLAIRFLTVEDIPFADSLRAGAGWNQTEKDWKRFVELSPQGCLLAECEGRPVATATTVCYGRDVAWIGMVLVHPDFRRRGIARVLMGHCIEHLRARRVRSIKLDATPEGREVYLKLGFRDGFGISRFVREGAVTAAPKVFDAISAEHVEKIVAMDAAAFGTERRELYQRLIGEGAGSAIGKAGFGLKRQGSRADYIGPVVAENAEEACAIAESLAAGSARVYCDIPDAQEAMLRWAAGAGFSPRRQLMRMWLGENVEGAAAGNYRAIAAPDLG